MKNLKNLLLILIPLAAASSMPAAYGQSDRQPPTSAKSSTASGTDANDEPSRSAIVNACAAAADELSRSRTFISALENKNAALAERLATERQISDLLAKVNATRESETAALRTALAAKDETIAAKNAVIDGRERLVAELKRKSRSPIRRITDVLIGAAVFAIIK